MREIILSIILPPSLYPTENGSEAKY